MKTTKLLKCALGAVVLAALVLVGCDELDMYSIDSPDDLQERIDAIADSLANLDTGDTTYLDITRPIVGAEDNSTGWFNDHSDFFGIPPNKQLHLEFYNYGSGGANWNNWNLAVANVAANSAEENPDHTNIVVDPSYEEYFVLRSDSYGWGNDDYDAALISNDYPDLNGDDDIWDDFRIIMEGAYVHIIVDHSVAGYAYVTATATGTDGTEINETYQHPVSATDDIFAFLITDASHFVMEKAYLLPSEMAVIEDEMPTSISITGTPASVEIGDTNFWGKATATVTFTDGTSEVVDSADLSFTVIPDMSTIGEKTVSVAYSKTKQGNYGPAVSTIFTLEVVDKVTSLELTNTPELTTYYFYDSDPIILDTAGLVVTATYLVSGESAVIDNGSLDIGMITPTDDDTISTNAVISFFGTNDTLTVTYPITLIKGIGQVGASDFSSPFYNVFSPDITVASGDSVTYKIYSYSNEAKNENCPQIVVRPASKTPFTIVKMDGTGLGAGFGSATSTNDWDFDVFKSNINGSYVEITVKNNGDNTADILYNVSYLNGETHFQKFEGITVTSSDMNCALTTQGAYLVIVE